MKSCLLLLCCFCLLFSNTSLAQLPAYEKEWKKIKGLEENGLTASASSEARNILKRAIAEENGPQQIKALVHIFRYNEALEEESGKANLALIDSQITTSRSPVTNILYSLRATLLKNEYEKNRFKIYSRSRITGVAGDDMDTWDARTFYEKISSMFLRSVDRPEILKKTMVGDFEVIVEKGVNTRTLRPTLYDLLAHRALDYFSYEEGETTLPASHFIINNEKIFATAADFVNCSFEQNDNSSPYYQAVLLLQQLTSFHLNDADKSALTDLSLIRLKFGYDHGVFQNKDRIYENSLWLMEKDPGLYTLAHRPMSMRAQLYFDQGQQYDPALKKTLRWKLKMARDLCDTIIKSYPGTEGGTAASILMRDLETKYISIETEKAYIPDEPIKCLIKYRNIGQVFLKVIPISSEQYIDLSRNQIPGEKDKFLNTAGTLNKKYKLPGTEDLCQHAAEFRIDALPAGNYLIVASQDSSFDGGSITITSLFIVSHISFIHHENKYYLADRQSGKPLPGARIHVWIEKYNEGERRWIMEKTTEQYASDASGHFEIGNGQEYRNFILEIIHRGTRLFTDMLYSGPEIKPDHGKTITSWIFTDRSIYRPGQTIFFKGIMAHNDNLNNKWEAASGIKTTIQLRDANYQLIASIPVKTGSMGSYSADFRIPEGLLNGRFQISDSVTGSVQAVQVEDYKRPRFTVTLDRPSGTYRLNDSIRITGHATSYAGIGLNDAKVAFKITRSMRSCQPLYYDRWWPPAPSNETFISSGEIKTDGNGTFTISFKAIPDETIEKENNPVFHYELTADVTDINGETRSGQSSISVSYKAVQVSIESPETLSADSMHLIRIISTNQQGDFEKCPVQVTIQKLVAPAGVIRKRYWEDPDMFLMTAEEHKKYFPDDPYDKEYIPSFWPAAEPGNTMLDSTSPNGKFRYSEKTTGWIRIKALARDKYGDTVVTETVAYVYRDPYGNIPSSAAAIVTPTTTFQPGERALFSINTNFDDIYALMDIHRPGNRTLSASPVLTKNKPYKNELSIGEEDRGGINIGIAFIKNNRIYVYDKMIGVPWSNKDLRISYETFRDKLLPGSREKWTVKISGMKGEQVAAEMLASMYDVSLDQFKEHSWWNLKNIWPNNISMTEWSHDNFGSNESIYYNPTVIFNPEEYIKRYDQLISMEPQYYFQNIKPGMAVRMEADLAANQPEGEMVVKFEAPALEKATNAGQAEEEKKPKPAEDISTRKNFNETAFYFPQLLAAPDGSIAFEFTMPEALTRWKLMLLAHTGDLASAYSEKEVITSKPLMAEANVTRFLREGDHAEIPVKISNSESKEMTGMARLELVNANTGQSVDGWFRNMFPVQYFTAEPGQSSVVHFPLDIPADFTGLLTMRVKASTSDNSFSDGEERIIPVLSNRILVTESLPISLRNEKKRKYLFEKLLNSGGSGTITNKGISVEYASNPAWYAIQSLPYLMEFPYECAEQNFNRYYANSLASHIAGSNPRIREIFETWKGKDTGALVSRLMKNEELKSILLEETPWVMDAKNESEAKQRLGMLFDMAGMATEQKKSLDKLRELQLSNGGFAWFKGGPDDRYITQYILCGTGHLLQLKAISSGINDEINTLISAALSYADLRMADEYKRLLQTKADLSKNRLSPFIIQYLYMRSFFIARPMPTEAKKPYAYYMKQAETFWLKNNKYFQGMIALAIHRSKPKSSIPTKIMQSLKQNAIVSDDMGMYWKDIARGGYYWQQASIESHALLTEAFFEIGGDKNIVDNLRTWLLRNKQTHSWSNTKATAEACYALLLGGKELSVNPARVSVTLGNQIIAPDSSEAGTEYFKVTIPADKVKPEMGRIEVSAEGGAEATALPGWGAVYWQYFEDADKVTPAAAGLNVSRQLFIEKKDDRGTLLTEIKEGNEVHPGDKIIVRIELRADRDLEYVHMKDMRAACMEPVNVLSDYKFQGGLGYYETTRDAATHFFFSFMQKGTYVFEYPLFAAQEGRYSNGITSIQCMYAPEFGAHSEGLKVTVAQ